MTSRYGLSGVVSGVRSSSSRKNTAGHLATTKKPTDIIYYTTSLSINGAVLGSIYAITDYKDKTNVVATGQITSDPQVIEFSANLLPMFLIIKLRKGTDGIKYLPFESLGKVTRNPADIFVFQVEDTIAELI